jgi:hypothetical protein
VDPHCRTDVNKKDEAEMESQEKQESSDFGVVEHELRSNDLQLLFGEEHENQDGQHRVNDHRVHRNENHRSD